MVKSKQEPIDGKEVLNSLFTMKLTIVILFATLLLAAAHANIAPEFAVEDFDINYVPQDAAANVEVDNFSIWTGMYWTLKTALRTLKGVNCTIKEVLQIKAACNQFLVDLANCGYQTTKQITAVIDSVNKVISICNDIINLNTNVCGNGEPLDNDNDVPSGKTSSSCFWKLLKKLVALKNQVKKTVTLVKKIPSIPGEAGTCVVNTCDSLTSAFTSFPSNIVVCSKLTS